MSSRREARECALKFLFGFDFTQDEYDVLLAQFKNYLDDYSKLGTHATFFEELVRGVVTHRDLLDIAIEEHSDNWKVKRMASVDRNILRIAAFELLYTKELSAKIIINEAIEIAKKFGDTESAAFINGVLDAIAKER